MPILSTDVESNIRLCRELCIEAKAKVRGHMMDGCDCAHVLTHQHFVISATATNAERWYTKHSSRAHASSHFRSASNTWAFLEPVTLWQRPSRSKVCSIGDASMQVQCGFNDVDAIPSSCFFPAASHVVNPSSHCTCSISSAGGPAATSSQDVRGSLFSRYQQLAKEHALWLSLGVLAYSSPLSCSSQLPRATLLASP